MTAVALGTLAGGVVAASKGFDVGLGYLLSVPWVVVVAIGVAGLVYARAWKSQVAERTEAICTDLATRLSTLPGVKKAEVEHRSARVTVSLDLDDGTETGPLVEEAVPLLWQSRLYPLRLMIWFGLQRDPVWPELRRRKAELRHRYGPRPYGPAPS